MATLEEILKLDSMSQDSNLKKSEAVAQGPDSEGLTSYLVPR